MIKDRHIQISLSGVGKFFGFVLAGSGLLTAFTALVLMLPGIGAYDTNLQVEAVQGHSKTFIVDVRETPGFVLDIFEDARTTRYIRTAANGWYDYETGLEVETVEKALEQAYRGFLLRQKAEEVLAAARNDEPEAAIEVSVPVEATETGEAELTSESELGAPKKLEASDFLPFGFEIPAQKD